MQSAYKFLLRWGVPLIPVLCVWLGLLFVHSFLAWSYQQTLLLELALPCIFFWRIYRPEAFVKGAVFATGLLMDVLVMSPFGMHALLYIVVMMFVDAQRNFLSQREFSEQWMIFLCCCIVLVLGRALSVWGMSDANITEYWVWIIMPLLAWFCFPIIYQMSNILYKWMNIMEERLHAV